jgi:hypothetical protein
MGALLAHDCSRRPAHAVGGQDATNHRRARTLVLLCALVAFTGLSAAPTASAAAPDGVFTSTFASLSASGWVGGDATNSIALPDGRDCWIFSDTITADSAAGLAFAHNSIVITGRGRPQVIDNPMRQPSPNAYYWAGAAHVHGAQVWEIAERIAQTGPGLWDFHLVGDYLAKINISNWRLSSITLLPGTLASTTNWGVAMLDRGPYTYIYGSETDGLASWMHIARVPRGRLDRPWSYYTASGWAHHHAKASLRLLAGIAPTFSVIDLGAHRGIRVISQQPLMGQAIYSRHAASAVGPFSAQRTIYTTPSHGARTYTYNTLAHPEQTTHGQMLFSYNVNSYDALTPADATLYRPRFFRTPLSAL